MRISILLFEGFLSRETTDTQLWAFDRADVPTADSWLVGHTIENW